MVEEVRERVIRAASYRPFEGGSRVFVLEAAEAMRDESQNALLKTLEEPPGFAHLILLSSEPEGLLETIASRCQPVEFAALPAEVVEAELAGDPSGDRRGPAGGRRGRAPRRRRPRARRACCSAGAGRELRAEVEGSRRGGARPPGCRSPGRGLLEAAEEAGEDAEGAAREALEEEERRG